LIGQGLLLPTVMRILGLENAGTNERRAERDEERLARQQGIQVSTLLIDQLSLEATFSAELADTLRSAQNDRLARLHGEDERDTLTQREEAELKLIEAERDAVNDLFRAGELKDDARRRIERELDLREASIRSYDDEI
jgi:CPA1 family monovalent cation:H+ antiporter